MATEEKTVRVGSRKSELALIQTKNVIAKLQRLHHKTEFEIHTMTTMGDRVLNISLPKIGEKSLFTRDLEDVLKQGCIDMIVHSLKDLPTVLPPKMVIGAILEREDPNDVLVLNNKYKNYNLNSLPAGSIIGTSSLRRTAQLKRYYKHLSVCDIRGNLNTRLAKLDACDSKFSGIILANAGIARMGWQNRIDHVFDSDNELMYAVGQGALAVECREDDVKTLEMLKNLRSIPTTCCVLAERSFLKTLGGGCSAPVAVTSSLTGDVLDTENAKLKLCGAVWSLDGFHEIRDEVICTLDVKCVSDKSVSDTATEASTADSNNKIAANTNSLNKLTEKTTNMSKENDNFNDKNDISSSSSEPPTKRARRQEEPIDNTVQTEPTVINDEQISDIVRSYDLKDLIAKHMEYMGGQSLRKSEDQLISDGAGDADNVIKSCPLKIGVGQEVMGRCPFQFNDNKFQTSLISSNGNDTNSECVDSKKNTDFAESGNNSLEGKYTECLPSGSGCPYQQNKCNEIPTILQDKCPFLRRAVKVLEYNNEKKTDQLNMTPSNELTNSSITNCNVEEKSYCGIYKFHSERECLLYEKCANLGRELAERLVAKGAIAIMSKAQSEIHNG